MEDTNLDPHDPEQWIHTLRDVALTRMSRSYVFIQNALRGQLLVPPTAARVAAYTEEDWSFKRDIGPRALEVMRLALQQFKLSFKRPAGDWMCQILVYFHFKKDIQTVAQCELRIELPPFRFSIGDTLMLTGFWPQVAPAVRDTLIDLTQHEMIICTKSWSTDKHDLPGILQRARDAGWTVTEHKPEEWR